MHQSMPCVDSILQHLQGFRVSLIDYPKLLEEPNVHHVNILKMNNYYRE